MHILISPTSPGDSVKVDLTSSKQISVFVHACCLMYMEIQEHDMSVILQTTCPEFVQLKRNFTILVQSSRFCACPLWNIYTCKDIQSSDDYEFFLHLELDWDCKVGIHHHILCGNCFPDILIFHQCSIFYVQFTINRCGLSELIFVMDFPNYQSL